MIIPFFQSKVYLGKFQQIIAQFSNSLRLSFSFFPQEIFFPKSTFEGLAKKIGQSFMNKRFALRQAAKYDNVINYQNGLHLQGMHVHYFCNHKHWLRFIQV